MSAERNWMQNPEVLRASFNGYIEALAKHQVPGQDSQAAQKALVYEEHDPTVGSDRHYWIDYEFQTVTGTTLFLRFQHAGHIPANNIDWDTNRGQVHYYTNDQMGLVLLYSNGGKA